RKNKRLFPLIFFSAMEVMKMVVGMFGTNSYMLTEDDKTILIDPAGKAEKFFGLLEGKKLLAVLLTHGHFDHIKAVDDLYDRYRMPVYIHKEDEELCRDKKQATSFGLPFSPVISCPVEYITDGINEIGPFRFVAIPTPGHTQGSCCFLFKECIFTGDTLFKGSVGRTDLKGGNNAKLRSSLRVLSELDPELTVYPGHEDTTTLKEELENNPYM
ncbi:MAG: MBL fold metallo-hydrolase, partial [Erysipelotrichaceae bacterium]|nr:MBL fold metallo-hydrolase [Erysipelotrichaceae bacterium]